MDKLLSLALAIAQGNPFALVAAFKGGAKFTTRDLPFYLLAVGYFYLFLAYTISTDDQYWLIRHDSTRNSSRDQNTTLLFVLFMCCSLY